MNRWIVPLERKVDYLSLDYGLKFGVPFECLVVFSTNIPPLELGDEAFFRRIPNKIYVGAVTPEEFDEITVRCLVSTGFAPDFTTAELVRDVCVAMGATSLRPCVPMDLCRIARSIVDFDDLPNRFDRSVAQQAADMYFTASGTHSESSSLFRLV